MDVSFGTLALSAIVLATCAIGWSASIFERRKLDRYLAEKRRRAAEAAPAE